MDEARDWLLHPQRRWKQRRRLTDLLKEIDEYSRERDPAENAESSPPANEEIRLHAVWMAESYPLSFFDVLLDAVRRLTADGRHVGDPPVERIEESLRLGGSGWFPLGPVVSPGSPLYAHASPIKTALPADVEYAHASVHYLVPSHAVLVVSFVLDDVGSRRVEQTLRATYRSYATERGDWTAVHSPANQKRAAVRVKRGEQLTELTSFFEREAPGLFAGAARPLPSIEFWTTKERTPFEEDREAGRRRSLNDFIQLLGWVAWTNTWRGPDSLTLKEAPLTGDDFWSRAPNLQLVARQADLFAGEDLKMYGGPSREAYVNRLKDSVDPLAAALALTETFRFYDAELVSSRRRLRDAQSRSLRRRVKATVAVQDRLLRQHADVDAIARGVARWKDDLLPLLRHHTVDFEGWLPPALRNAGGGEQLVKRKGGWPRRWLARLKSGVGEPEQLEAKQGRPPRETWLESQTREILARSEHVVGGSREISDVVRTISETTSAQASLRLQRQIAVLTWALAAIGIATLIVVIVTAK
jgi:hypothetical protein